MLRPLPALPCAERQGKPHSLQSGHAGLPEWGEPAISTTPPCVKLPNKLMCASVQHCVKAGPEKKQQPLSMLSLFFISETISQVCSVVNKL